MHTLELRGERESRVDGSARKTNKPYIVSAILRTSAQVENKKVGGRRAYCRRVPRGTNGAYVLHPENRSCKNEDREERSGRKKGRKEERRGRASRKETRRWPTVTECGRICEECVLEGSREKRSSKRGSIALTGSRRVPPCLFPPRRRHRRHRPHHHRHCYYRHHYRYHHHHRSALDTVVIAQFEKLLSIGLRRVKESGISSPESQPANVNGKKNTILFPS